MATPLPAPLKNADVSRYALRAAQLEKYKPIIAYWCEYLIVNSILNKGLHTESDECMTFTTNLMDKLERFKADNATSDAVHDDVAAEAYVEQFAMETLQRAETAIKANKATAQTADTFRAAATFLDLLSIWQTPLEPEIATKSKFAKFHALRIAKALKAGEDPNLSNPIQEKPPSPGLLVLSPNDPEVRAITSLQPSIEDGSDHEQEPSFIDRPPPSRSPPTQQPQAPPQDEVSPLDAPPPSEGYFPSVPTFTADETPHSLPTASSDTIMGDSPQDFYIQQASPPQHPLPPRIPQAPSDYNTIPEIPPAPSEPFPHPVPSSTPIQPQRKREFQHLPQQSYRRDDDAVLLAQKHAKWAISALNFEDVDTAVNELKTALQALGAI